MKNLFLLIAFFTTAESWSSTNALVFSYGLAPRLLENSIILACRLNPHETQEVKVRSGFDTLDQLPIKLGQRVEKGALLAHAATTKIDTSLQELEKKLHTSKDNVAKAQQELGLKEQDLGRAKHSFEQGTTSGNNLTSENLSLESAKINLEKSNIEARLQERQLAIEKQKLNQASYFANFSGMVTALNLPNQAVLNKFVAEENKVLIQLATMGSYDLGCSALDFQAFALKTASQGKVKIWGEDKDRTCIIQSIGIARSKDKGNTYGPKKAENTSFTVICHFDDPERVFPRNLMTTVSFVQESSQVAQTLPWEAIRVDDEGKAWVKKGSADAPLGSDQLVSLGKRDHQAVEITAGLSEDDLVMVVP